MIVYEDTAITIFQSALYQTNSLIYKTDAFLLLVDPNWLPGEVQLIRNYIDQHHSDKPIYLLFTHSDYDHIIGYGLFPEAKVIASAGFQDLSDKAKVIGEIHQFDQQHYIKRTYPISFPEVDILIENDGQMLEIEGERFTFYLSPGHTQDGIFTIIESKGIFIAGDYLSDLEFPFIYYSSDEYFETLKKVDAILEKHNITFLVPGHGNFINNNQAEILSRRDRDMKYIFDLKASILNNSPFPLAHCLSRFSFPDGLKAEHEKNLKRESNKG